MSVVITGFGACSPLGCSFGECLETLRKGERRIADIEAFDCSEYDVKAAGEIREGGKYVPTPRNVDRKIHFFARALAELEEATGFTSRYSPSERFLSIGGGVDYYDVVSNMEGSPDKETIHEMLSGIRNIAARYGIEAGCNVFSSACTASGHAIGQSFRLLKHGLAKMVVSGGADSMINPFSYLGFFRIGAMSTLNEPSPYICRPCDLRASGTVLGEAAVAILLEDSARLAPDAKVYAEILGYGSSMDAWSVTDPEPSGEAAAKAIEAALEEAGVRPEEIDCVHLHGTGTPKCAPAEYNALERVFGERAREIPVYSMKGQVGHCIGASTALEFIGVAYSFMNQEVLPTVNFETPHPAAPLNVIKGEPLHIPVRHILKLNSALGGHNTAFVLKKWER